MAEPISRTQVFTVVKHPSGRHYVTEGGNYAPISLRIDSAQPGAQVRFALNAFLNHFTEAGS